MFEINLFITSVIITGFNIYVASKLLAAKPNLKNKTSIITIAICFFGLAFVSVYFESFVRTMLTFLSIFGIYKFVFKTELSKATVMSVISMFLYFISEIVFSLVLVLVFKVDNETIMTFWKGSFITNLLVCLIFFLFLKLKIVNRAINTIIKLKQNTTIAIIILCSIISMGIFGTKNSKMIGNNFGFILNLLVIIIFFIFLFNLIREKYINQKSAEKYDQLLKYIERFEEELTTKKMIIHEYKNQLVSLKGFIPKSNKKAGLYLNSIVDDLSMTESKLLSGMDAIPSGGLKGLLYYKLGNIEAKKIDVLLNVSKNLNRNLISKMEIKLYNDILKIIGVYLDNAIEAASLSNKRQLTVEIYTEKKQLNIIVANTYDNILNRESIGKVGFSTKGRERGYGLALTKKIIESQPIITERSIVEDGIYTQSLAINL